jgi:hypothetical protein
LLQAHNGFAFNLKIQAINQTKYTKDEWSISWWALCLGGIIKFKQFIPQSTQMSQRLMEYFLVGFVPWWDNKIQTIYHTNHTKCTKVNH